MTQSLPIEDQQNQGVAVDALLPCPFCGGEAELASYNSCDCCGKAWNGQVVCQGCGQGVSHFDTDAEAIAAWNTRKPAAPLLLEALEKAVAYYDGLSRPHDDGEAALLDSLTAAIASARGGQ
jgi:Lar family restriction alleviation protein